MCSDINYSVANCTNFLLKISLTSHSNYRSLVDDVLIISNFYPSVMDRIYNLLTEEKFSEAILLLSAFKEAYPDNCFLQELTKESQRYCQ